MIFRYKKTLASVFFVFVLLVIFTFINQDDELYPDIPAFLELSAPVPANDGHAVLYALDAPIGSDVIALGHDLIHAQQTNLEFLELEDRLDLMALDFYQDASLWWVIHQQTHYLEIQYMHQ